MISNPLVAALGCDSSGAVEYPKAEQGQPWSQIRWLDELNHFIFERLFPHAPIPTSGGPYANTFHKSVDCKDGRVYSVQFTGFKEDPSSNMMMGQWVASPFAVFPDMTPNRMLINKWRHWYTAVSFTKEELHWKDGHIGERQSFPAGAYHPGDNFDVMICRKYTGGQNTQPLTLVLENALRSMEFMLQNATEVNGQLEAPPEMT